MIRIGGDGRRVVEVRLGYKCNNNCIHCNVSDKRHLSDKSTEICKANLKSGREGRDLLILSGGEPTLRKDIFELIRFSRKELNYEYVQLETNGRMFFYRDFAERMVETINRSPVKTPFYISNKNHFSFRVSIHSDTALLHDGITRTSGSFYQTIEGLKNLKALGQEVITNTVISKANYRFLPRIAEFLIKNGADELEFSLIHAADGVYKNNGNIMLSLKEAGPHIKDLIALANKGNVRLRVENIPYCYLEGNENLLSNLYYPPDARTRLKIVDIDGNCIGGDGDKIKCVHSAGCKYGPACEGLYKNYFKSFGFKDVKPDLSFGQKPPSGKKSVFEEVSFEFHDKNRKPGFDKIKAEAIVLFSGGVDSKTAASVFAKSHRNKKIALITYSHGCDFNIEKSSLSAKELMRIRPNIIKHLIIPIPRPLLKFAILDNIEKWRKKYGASRLCLACHFLNLCFSVYLHKKYFDGDVIISGLRSGSNQPATTVPFFKNFLKQYSIDYLTPLFEICSKDKVKKIAVKEGLTPESNQSQCLLGPIMSTQPKGDYNHPSGHDVYEKFGVNANKEQEVCEEFAKIFDKILERNNITQVKRHIAD